MADLPKPQRIMKRLLILLLALMPFLASAQNYKQLGPVDVPDNYATKIDTKESKFPVQTYTISHMLASRGISVAVDVPPTYDFFIKTSSSVPAGTKAILHVGGVEYPLTAYYEAYGTVYIELELKHITHISFSGVQSIQFGNGVNETFNDIQQELWRRTAEKARDLVLEIYK